MQLVPAEEDPVPAQMQLVPAEEDPVPAEADQGSAEEQLVSAETDLVLAEADQGSTEEQLVPAEADLVPAEADLVPAQMQLVPAEEDPVPAEADHGSAEEQLVSAEAGQGSAETQLVSTRTWPADTACKKTSSAVTEDPGPVLPSEREAGATALCAEATRLVESAEALTSPQSRVSMPAAVGEERREPRGGAPSPPRKSCNVAGGDGWRGQLSRRNPGLIKEFCGLPPAARLNLLRVRGLCSWCLSCCNPKGERMHKRCWLKSQIENELCQKQHKCRKTHHQLLQLDAEGERSPQTVRPAKPAEPPNRSGRSPAYR
jgi:hypothetical protein